MGRRTRRMMRKKRKQSVEVGGCLMQNVKKELLAEHISGSSDKLN
jgi:hypothetical protein